MVAVYGKMGVLYFVPWYYGASMNWVAYPLLDFVCLIKYKIRLLQQFILSYFRFDNMTN